MCEGDYSDCRCFAFGGEKKLFRVCLMAVKATGNWNRVVGLWLLHRASYEASEIREQRMEPYSGLKNKWRKKSEHSCSCAHQPISGAVNG